ncbi:MAG: SlyX family protein [Woeseiaceae bacterium]|nr:SlyX family protein [Woeseiaceae bacterium]
MSDERLDRMEEKLAYQEHTLIELNEALVKQQDSIMRLERLCASMAEQIATLDEDRGSAGAADDAPPHY